MSNSHTRRIPQYRLHKARGLAVVRLDGRDHYLGTYGSPESKAKYDRLIAGWLTAPRTSTNRPQAQSMTVRRVIEQYQEHAREEFTQRAGSSTARNFAAASARLMERWGELPAEELRPEHLRELRRQCIADGLVRTTINDYISRIKTAWAWAEEQGKVSSQTMAMLNLVRSIKPGTAGTIDNEPVEPPTDEQILAIEPYCTPSVWNMVWLQLLTGARPGELVGLRACDLNQEKPVWVYRPLKHKGMRQGKKRRVLFGPQSQRILQPLMITLAAPLFPARWGRAFTVSGYRQAIVRACQQAGIASWSPHRLRHYRASDAMERADLRTVADLLGHSKATTTLIYAKESEKRADEAALRFG